MSTLLRASWPGLIAVVVALHALPSRVLSDGYPHYSGWFYALLSAGWVSLIGLYAGLIRLHFVAGESPQLDGPPLRPLELLAGDLPPAVPTDVPVPFPTEQRSAA